MIYIRDEMAVNRGLCNSEKDIFVCAIENSLNLFQRGYIDADCESGILPAVLRNQLDNAVRSQIYYHANELHVMLANEIALMRLSKTRQVYRILINQIKNLIPFKFINQYKSLFQLKRERNKK
jgi:hypothetical protein